MSLSAYLFGAPRIEQDGQPVQVDTRKALALFAYLAVTGRAHSREHLATLLWPENDSSHAYGALRRTLSTLHKTLGGQGMLITRDLIGLDKNADIWIDVDAFHQLIARIQKVDRDPSSDEFCSECLVPLTQAAELYRGDLLAGFTLRDSAAFDDWQYFQAESLRRELASVLERLVDLNTRLEEYDLAIEHARRWLALDSLNELAHRQLMCVYAWAGRRNAALHQYQDCTQVLKQELGIEPLAETTRLYQDIKANGLPARPAQARPTITYAVPAVTPPAPPEPEPALTPLQSDYPLVGRTAEWSKLQQIYAAQRSGGSFVVLEGEAGVGKTRLADEFLRSLRKQGVFVISARCYQGEANVAYGPFIDVLRSAVKGSGERPWWDGLPAHWLSEVSRLLPELSGLTGVAPPAAPLESPGAQSHFYESISQVLLALCGGCELSVLFLDDLHWADESSIDLLFYLMRRLDHLPVHILATWRAEQVPGEHRLRNLLAEIQRNGAAYQIQVSRLEPTAVLELVGKCVPGEAGLIKQLGERLYQETEGLPFFLIEYLAGIAAGRIDLRMDGLSLPNGARDLIRSRLKDVQETSWQFLQAAAVLGRSFDFDVLRQASGRTEEESVTALEELIRLGVILEASIPSPFGANALPILAAYPLTYDFSHDKIRGWVYEETSQTRRHLLHRRAAEALTVHSRLLPNAYALAGQIGYHYKQAGMAKEAAEYYRQAGEYAIRLYANSDALAHFKAALVLGYPDLGGLTEQIGDLHMLRGEYTTALGSFENAAALHAQSPSDLGRLAHKRGEIYRRLGDWDLAEQHFQSAADALEQANDQGKWAQLLADWSHIARQQGQLERALGLASQALSLAELAKDQPALMQAYNALGILIRSQGDLKKASHYLEQSLEIAKRIDQPIAQIAALNNLALVYTDCDDNEQAITLEQIALQLCILQGDRHREAAIHNNLADLYHRSGQSETSMTHLKQAVTILAEIGVEAGSLKPEIWRMVEW
ncbi:MAG: hypothetical protein EHM70_11335 [Chloroflexota bacterium]|nr:MAG: hypothetical protein EHM70_11335 [Chloroflexota bacterium]